MTPARSKTYIKPNIAAVETVVEQDSGKSIALVYQKYFANNSEEAFAPEKKCVLGGYHIFSLRRKRNSILNVPENFGERKL